MKNIQATSAYLVTCGCGHEFMVNLLPIINSNRQKEFQAKRIIFACCPDCLKNSHMEANLIKEAK